MKNIKFLEKIREMKMNIIIKKIIGAVLIILGLVLHLIPLFPAGWIIIVGLEFLGIRLLLYDKLKMKLPRIFK